MIQALNPGHLKTNLQRHTDGFITRHFGGLVLHDPHLGALTELYAGFSETVGLGNNGAYVIPWGRVGRTRRDIEAGFQERETGKRLWNMLEKETLQYL
jgi:retinol dehydrogenase 12